MAHKAVFQLGYAFYPVVLSAARVTSRRDERKSRAPARMIFASWGGKSKAPRGSVPLTCSFRAFLLKTLLPNQLASCDLKQHGMLWSNSLITGDV
jgi:hypothetical protein